MQFEPVSWRERMLKAPRDSVSRCRHATWRRSRWHSRSVCSVRSTFGSDGEVVDVRSAQLRRLLGLLLTAQGRPRPASSLVDELWPDSQMPTDPRATVQTYVSRLRSTLGSEVITSTGGGYSLRVEPEVVDARHFERLLREAGRPLPASEREELLGEALALWRGEAFGELAGEPWCRAEAARLDELHAAAVDGHATTLLELGLATEAVAELTAAALRHPLRERTHLLLMRSLFAEGRQADALRVSHGYRRRLATDLGLEPGEAIAALESELASGTSETVPTPTLPGYDLLEQIGDGAQAIVYRALQRAVGREVAVKVIRPELADQPGFIGRFEREAQLVARLEHPSIVPLIDFWRRPGAAVLITRLLRGGTFRDRLERAPLSLGEATRLVRQIGGALIAAHQAGIVHLDVNPSNVFLDETANYFLGDFGIAHHRNAESEEFDRLAQGSPSYAAPEQLRGEPCGERADVYGLAATVHAALTGNRPYAGCGSAEELFGRQQHEPIGSIATARPEVPAAVDRVLARGTAKVVADRHHSVAELVTTLVAALGGGDRHDGSARDDQSALVPVRNPYKGLHAFDEADSIDFHGRATALAVVLDQIRRPELAVVTLVGPSGCGKSSLARAGLLPAILSGALGDRRRWLVAAMTPARRRLLRSPKR